jgi:hypothetical protein
MDKKSSIKKTNSVVDIKKMQKVKDEEKNEDQILIDLYTKHNEAS